MTMVLTILLTIVVTLLLLLGAAWLWTLALARRAEMVVPRTGRLRRVRAGAIHFVEKGPKDAPPIVLIHGISAQLQHFTYAIADLLADEFRVIAIDRPGCGYSERERDEDAALAEQARMIGAFLDAEEIVSPVIVGHSLGGAVALAIALDRPMQTGALALLAPATHVQAEIDPVFKGLEVRTSFMRRFLGNTIAVPMARLTADKVLAHAFAPEVPVEDFMRRAGGALGLRPKAYVSGCCDLVMLEQAMPRQVARYGELGVPGGVLYGSDDALLSPRVHGRPMEAFGLSYEELPGKGHMLPITAPQECADFIRRIAKPASD